MQASEAMSQARAEALARRDARLAAIHECYREECKADDLRHDEEYTKARDRAQDELARLAKRPRPDHSAAKARQDAEITEAEQQLEADICSLFLEHGISPDTRHN